MLRVLGFGRIILDAGLRRIVGSDYFALVNDHHLLVFCTLEVGSLKVLLRDTNIANYPITVLVSGSVDSLLTVADGRRLIRDRRVPSLDGFSLWNLFPRLLAQGVVFRENLLDVSIFEVEDQILRNWLNFTSLLRGKHMLLLASWSTDHPAGLARHQIYIMGLCLHAVV